MKIPDGYLTDEQIEKLWAADRASLVACYGDKRNFAAYIRRLKVEFEAAARKN